MLIILLTTIYSLAASAECAAGDPNCAMKSGGAGFTAQGPGCADCLKFQNNRTRLTQPGSGAFDNTNVPVPRNDDDSTGTDK